MARIEKTVFLTYRRDDRSAALGISKDLTQHGFDVFIDHEGIGPGDFEHAIVANIRARAHFIVFLTPTALERLDEPGDSLRRELAAALAASFQPHRLGTRPAWRMDPTVDSLSCRSGYRVKVFVRGSATAVLTDPQRRRRPPPRVWR